MMFGDTPAFLEVAREEARVAEAEEIAVVAVSMLGTYALLLLVSKRYRDDTAKMFRLEKTSVSIAIEHPFATAAHILSFLLPVLLMDLPV